MCAQGCRVDIKNNKEMTPLHSENNSRFLIFLFNYQILLILFKHQIAATEKNEIDAVRTLCLAGLDLSITNKDGMTAEQMAIILKYTHIANLLMSLRKVSYYNYYR